ncbi:MAG: folylpolyglutamate synthase/dihydrofolate synthase family protein [bacterium]
MKFTDSIRYLDNFSNYEKKAHLLKARFTLTQIKTLMKLMDYPQKRYPAVHVAGTVGKGSVCHMIAASLTAAGYKTGLYTSPHLNDIRERIEIDGRMISKSAFADAVERVKSVAKDKYDIYTYFEILTAAALGAFANIGVEIAVVETGLGGRLDATNVVSPFISVITPIGWDHQQVLGNTLSGIAGEKAGIIKRGEAVVSTAQRHEAMSVIRAACEEKHAALFISRPGDLAIPVKSDAGSDRYEIKMKCECRFEVDLPLSGSFQRQNLAAALMVLELLDTKGFHAGSESIKKGIENMRFPGRMEKIKVQSGQGECILDGAHNVPAARAFAEHIAKNETGRDIVLVVGMMRDKDAKGVLKELSAVRCRIITTGLMYDRAFKSGPLAEIASGYFKAPLKANSMDEALRMGARLLKSNGLLCVTGSLYAVAEARTFLHLY